MSRRTVTTDLTYSFTSFGLFLRYLRRRAQLTQLDLGLAVGYSVPHISLLENDQRLPDLTTLAALFVPALGLNDEPELVARLLELAAAARGDAKRLTISRSVRREIVAEEIIETAVSEARSPLPPDLPAPILPLLGRDEELDALRAMLLDPAVRFLTLTGPPGVGKTRLALRLAWQTHDAFRDSARFVELAAIRDPALVATAVRGTLNLSDGGVVGMEAEQIWQGLRQKEMLLVLDNFEHLMPAAPFVADLLSAAPGLKVLITSRAALHLYGEHLFPVSPLALPELTSLSPLDELAQLPSVALLAARARAARPDFALTPANALAVAAICVQLDGLPLAIELAAAQLGRFPPQELAARLANRLSTLRHGARNLPARQRTLRGAIDWSYALLEPEEQRFFAQLSVFAGGFTSEAAEAVAHPSSSGDDLASLVDRSLIQRSERDGDMRFYMLESLREFARERLAQSGEESATRRHHAETFTALAEEAFPHLFAADQLVWLARLRREHDNLRAALRWACEAGATETGLRLGAALWWFWYRQGFLSEGRVWLDRLLALPSPTPSSDEHLSLRANVLNGAGSMAAEQGNYDRAERYHGEAVQLRRSIGDGRGLATSLHNLALVMRERGDPAHALQLLEENLALDRQSARAHDLAMTLVNLGITAGEMGDYDRAEMWLSEGLFQARASDDGWCVGFALQSFSDFCFAHGRYDEAISLAEDSLALFSALGDRQYMADSLKRLGQVARLRGDMVAALAFLEEGLALSEKVGNHRCAAECREDLAKLTLRDDISTKKRGS